MRGFLAIVSRHPIDPVMAFAVLSEARSCGLSVVLRTDRVLVAASGLAKCVLARDSGVILGDIYYRHGPAGAFDGSAREVEMLTKICHDDELGERCWGSFLAIVDTPSRDAPRVHHSPFSSLGAFVAEKDRTILVASDARLLARAAGRPASIDWSTVASQLARDDLSLRSTCLDKIRELRCGEMLELPADAPGVFTRTWDPWFHAHADRAVLDRGEALELLERELIRCGDACLHGLGPSILDLSGGLDSSLLAALCARGRGEVQAVNMFSAATEGDERGYAREVAAHLGLALAEQAPDATCVDIQRCARPNLPRPYVRSFVQETDRLTMAATPDALAFLNGTGGDAVFCHLQSSGPAVDVLRTPGTGQGFLHTVREVAEAARCSVWTGLRKSLVKAARRHKRVPLQPERTFLMRGSGETIPDEELPWPAPPREILPGKLDHVRGLYLSSFNLNAFGRADSLRSIYPLMSQPLIEACLRIPTWHWIGRGYNRLPAREIASHWLPPNVAWRVSKGGLGQLQRDIFRLNRLRIREILLDGQLQGQGLLDRRSLEKALEPDSSLLVGTFSRVLRLVDFEAWAKTWT
jgi:asparagine synthase (glutamine-hydrolysing)